MTANKPVYVIFIEKEMHLVEAWTVQFAIKKAMRQYGYGCGLRHSLPKATPELSITVRRLD